MAVINYLYDRLDLQSITMEMNVHYMKLITDCNSHLLLWLLWHHQNYLWSNTNYVFACKAEGPSIVGVPTYIALTVLKVLI